MTRIPTIESAVKSAYHDCHQNTDAMTSHVIKALGADGEQMNPHAIERRIRRHVITDGWRKLAEEIDAMLPMAGDDDWIQWSGGECPVPPETVVDYRLDNGNRESACRAGALVWRHGYDPDIIAYRIVTPAPATPPQEQPLDEKMAIECLFECLAAYIDARTIGDQEGMKKAAAEGQRFLEGMDSLTAFAARIARMTQDGEEVDGREFVMENDDAVTTLNELIDEARGLV